ncbi:EEIG1/EHBP1 N-terminal domain containing protein [Trema orientale]|uniref:EEIG1/EHBP1 N-terminal domain containing protein n=1 Tax=Trema orientale TaxID=63057 RepID=A0A2P5FKP7_TREOI|nr:EEIG1/EHBP1 N-terminal domain containing protein [Trema orientale]
MVVKMMRWRPWPPLVTKKYEVRLVVRRLEGCDLVREGAAGGVELGKLTVEIRWKGPKMALSSLRRPAVKRNFTREVDASLVQNGVVDWDEEFQSHCSFSAYKDNVFHPWEIAFTVFNGLNQGPKNKIPIIGTALVNLAEFVSAAEQKELELNIPLTPCAGSSDPCPTLCLSLSLLELRIAQETAEPVERSIVPASSPPQSVEAVSTEKDELSALKAGLKKVKIFTGYVSSRKAKKACREGEGSDGRCSAKSDGEYNYPFDSDSLDDFEEGESDEGKEDATVRKSFSYGTLAYANYAGGSFYSDARINTEDEDLVYYSNRKSDVGCSHVEDSATSVSEPPLLQSSKRGLLSWRKRKLSFRSPKAKGEPLLKKAYGEEGGDDIDFDRRQLSSDESLPLGRHKTEEDSSANRSSVSEFGDDSFAIGSWEHKEVTSRDGHMKLQTEVFFASIDQRSERAAGESACTALVAVIADWFQNNQDLMPIKSQFDSLIREGSLEWRNLCENETYKERFPDKHFDLETVLQAKIRPLSVVSQKSFIGFFHPEGIMDEGRFDFLHGAMSFDNIWDEISRAGSECLSSGEPQVYIVSWNDHFFLLKVEPEAYYIVDTLGERLYEGCNQAYILKFDSNTVIHKMSNAAQGSDDKTTGDQQIMAAAVEAKSQPVNPKEESLVGEALVTKPEESMKEEEVVCKGKESCKEYIKSFLAAIPLRELQADMKKGLMASTPLHQRLQIEFNYTQSLQSLPDIPVAIAPPADVSIAEFATCT